MVAPTVQVGSLVLTPVAAAAVAVVVQPTVQITGGNVEITPAAVTVIAWAVLGGAQGGEPDKTSNLAWILFIRL
jgi:ethanolamine transporter EutH